MEPEHGDEAETQEATLDRMVEAVRRIRMHDFDEFLLREELESRLADESEAEILQDFYDREDPDGYYCCRGFVPMEWSLHHLAIAHRDTKAASLINRGTNRASNRFEIPWPRRSPFPVAYFTVVRRRKRCEWSFRHGPGSWGIVSSPEIIAAQIELSKTLGLHGRHRAPGHER